MFHNLFFRIAFVLFIFNLSVSALRAQLSVNVKKEFISYQELDAANNPPQGATVFLGSSSIRMWDNLEDYFPHEIIVKRGFGGATLTDLHWITMNLILDYKPKKIVIYAGENDVAFFPELKPEQIASRALELVDLIREANPETSVLFLSCKPSPLRWNLAERMVETNRLIFSSLADYKNVFFINVWDILMDEKGNPNSEYYLPDALHLNASGYQKWQNEINKYLNN